MKHIFLFLLCALLAGGTASAQRFRVGVRGGINAADYRFTPVKIGSSTFSPGNTRVGFETGFVLRLNLTKHLHLQSEINYDFANYSVRSEGPVRRSITLRAERLEIPVQLGLQFGIVRLFAGASFRVADSERSTAPGLLKVEFNNDDIALVGGLGLNIGHFFLDLRIQGYPRSRSWNTFTSNGVAERVEVTRDLIYGGSIGFFF